MVIYNNLLKNTNKQDNIYKKEEFQIYLFKFFQVQIIAIIHQKAYSKTHQIQETNFQVVLLLNKLFTEILNQQIFLLNQMVIQQQQILVYVEQLKKTNMLKLYVDLHYTLLQKYYRKNHILLQQIFIHQVQYYLN